MCKQHKDNIYLIFFNGIFFLWLKASITDINTTDVSIKNIFPPKYLTIDCSHSALQYNWELSILTFIRLNF